MIKPKIVVRSYKRPDMILKKTFGELAKQQDINLGEQLILVVADKEEYKAYMDVLGDFPLYDVIVSGNGHEGGHIAHNVAIDYLPEGEPVVFMDDDLTNMKISEDINDDSTKRPLVELGSAYSYALERMTQSDIFSIYYVSNTFFKQNYPFLEFRPKLVGGSWWGCYNSDYFKVTQGHDDDIIRTAKTIHKYGGSYFLNWIHANTANFTTKGGMQASGERGENRKATTTALCEQALMNHPEIGIYFEDKLKETNGGCMTRKLKHINTLKKIVGCYDAEKWSGYFQDDKDASDIGHIQLM